MEPSHGVSWSEFPLNFRCFIHIYGYVLCKTAELQKQASERREWVCEHAEGITFHVSNPSFSLTPEQQKRETTETSKTTEKSKRSEEVSSDS